VLSEIIKETGMPVFTARGEIEGVRFFWSVSG
jgi:hypothetical protein